jgi:hypothetical protein
VAFRLPIEADANKRRGQEIDPDQIVTRLQAAAESTEPESISAKDLHANGE